MTLSPTILGRVATVGLASLLVVLGAACSSDDDTATTTVPATETETTAPAGTEAPAPDADATTSGLPTADSLLVRVPGFTAFPLPADLVATELEQFAEVDTIGFLDDITVGAYLADGAQVPVVVIALVSQLAADDPAAGQLFVEGLYEGLGTAPEQAQFGPYPGLAGIGPDGSVYLFSTPSSEAPAAFLVIAEVLAEGEAVMEALLDNAAG